MALISDFFNIEELVCKDVYQHFKEKAWDFFDPRLLENLLFIRIGLDKPVWVNSWKVGGGYSERGFRCNLCKLVKEKTQKGLIYVSAHMEGMAVDFTVSGMSAEDVRTWIKAHSELMPYPCRIEDGVNWVHLDVRNDGKKGRVVTFKA